MDASQIDAQEEYLTTLFDDYRYQIPKFQRPFSWTEEHFRDLIDDLTDSYDVGREAHSELLDESGSLQMATKDQYEPYFLGSIILNAGEASGERYDIIDGQQRITSLSILIAVLRDMIEGTNTLGGMVHQAGDPYHGKEETIRLEVRQRDMDFFRENVLEEGATIDAPSPEKGETEPEENILQAIHVFRNALQEWQEEEDGTLADFGVFLTLRVVMVRITTNSLSSAFRLFNVTNARGMPLNNADLLKSENLSAIEDDEKREQYQRTWEDMEEEVGNEGLERFIGFMRHLLVKEKSRKSVYDEFKQRVFGQNDKFKGEKFVKYLERVFETHRKRVYNAELNTNSQEVNVYYHNLVSLMRDFYPSDEWIVALIRFDDKFEDEMALSSFVQRLEKRLTVDWLTGGSFNDRYNRVYDLLDEIEAADSPDEVLDLPVLNEEIHGRKDDFKSSLNINNFYRKGRYQWPRYILMRLNIERFDNRNRKVEYGSNVSIEHILPQTPTDEYWTSRFDDERMRDDWADRMGNLVPLDGRKNYQASNKPFPEKYDDYFAKKSDFPLVTELEDYGEWTPEHLRDRHEKLRQEALDIWM
ncbi:DUF262 domain-containing protein [Halococcus thailandensis]|uniref:DUF262 domain-containing protein n=1 Tax=Halococcus thailandensis JCM 13552 TaxID=1227457 RepID=M0ND42_9EURY|nr:DUF262 domain-containing protein [Halococcus thailandensis]EMA54989.1 hypothetical protein C451_05750 [Halococcus thailandensis JCM 13552]